MRKVIIILAALAGLAIVSCDVKQDEPQTFEKVKEEPTKSVTQITDKSVKIDFLTSSVENSSGWNQGLYKITLEDGKEILLYRGTESCAMLQLK